MNLLLLTYNNYFNRIVKKESSIDDYESVATHSYQYETRNFNPADGINTVTIINTAHKDSGSTYVEDVTFSPDYIVAFDDQENIVSRWFVTEWLRTRAGQYSAKLKRDVIADYYDQVVTSPCYIEKGTINSIQNPLVFNSEGLQLNQIKKSEYRLDDGSGLNGWYVVYLAKNLTDDEGTHNQVTVQFDDPPSYTTLPDNFKFTSGNYNFQKTTTNNHLGINWTSSNHTYKVAMDLNERDMSSVEEWYPSLDKMPTLKSDYDKQVVRTEINDFVDNSDRQDIVESLQVDLGLNSNYELEQVLSYNHKIVTYRNKKYRFLTYTIVSVKTTVPIATSYEQTNTVIGNTIESTTVDGTPLFVDTTLSNNNYTYTYDEVTVKVHLEPITAYSITYTIPTNRKKTNAQYDIIAFPGPGLLVNYGDEQQFTTTDCRAIVDAIATQLSGFVYDVQLVPYSPIHRLGLFETGEMWLSGLSSNEYTLLQVTNGPFGLAIYPEEASSTFELLDSFIPSLNDYASLTPTELKVRNEGEFVRICSPNYNGQFEMTPAKNYGCGNFVVDCLYQPNSPYIHIRPQFNGLYGSEFGDCRGLICSGDFSLPRIDDKFIDYQIQNKNYENLFNREIQSMEKLHKYDRISNIAGSIAGTGSGAISGAVLTGGNPVGAIGGAALSAVGGVADIAMAEGRYKEQKDLAIDKFNMSLENIQALPYSVTKVNPITPNNKILPFLEVFDCTEEEKEMIRNKITYSGMTIGAIGTIQEYSGGYVKGQMIRLNGIEEDSHLTETIYNEILKGVFI